MITNGITIPDPSSKTEYIPDSVGGWVYAVTTTITVSQQRLDDFKDKVADVEQRANDALAELAELKKHEPTILEALSSFVDAILPDSSPATSTPNKI